MSDEKDILLERSKLSAHQKALKRLSLKSISIIEEVLDDEKNEKYDKKTRLDVAKFASQEFVKVTDMMTKEGIQKVMLLVKGAQMNNPKTKEIENSEDTQPQAVFTTNILDVEKTSEDYEPPEEGQFDASDWKTI